MDKLFSDIQTTALHTDAERADMWRELLQNEMPNHRTAQVRRAFGTLQALRARRDKKQNEADHLRHKQRAALQKDPTAPAPFVLDIEFLETQRDIYNRAAEVWADELIIAMQEIRRDLAELLAREYGNVAIDIVDGLQSGTL